MTGFIVNFKFTIFSGRKNEDQKKQSSANFLSSFLVKVNTNFSLDNLWNIAFKMYLGSGYLI